MDTPVRWIVCLVVRVWVYSVVHRLLSSCANWRMPPGLTIVGVRKSSVNEAAGTGEGIGYR